MTEVSRMSIVQLLRASKDEYLTIEKFELNDLSTYHTIRFLIENSNDITKYFAEKNLVALDNENNYYDFLFLEFIMKFEEDIEFIPKEFGLPLEDIVEWAKMQKSQITNEQIIKCIQSNFISIFELANLHHDMGLMDETLKYLIQFYSGVKECGVFEYLIKGHTDYVFDHFEEIYDILKKDNQILLRMLLIDNIQNIAQMKFKQICELIRGIYHRGFHEIASESGRVMFKNIQKRYDRGEDVYMLQGDLKSAYDMLYQIKAEEARLMIPWIRDVDEKVSKRIMTTGQEFKYEIPTAPYMECMDKNKNVFSLYRYLTVTHDIKNDEKLWKSKVDTINQTLEQFIVDLIASSRGTNSYFSISRLNTFDIDASKYSVCLTYWFSTLELESEFRASLKLAVNSIFEIVGYNIDFEGLEDDMDCFVDIVSEAIKEHKDGISVFNKTMYSMAFLEKILRLIYAAVDRNIFFEKNVTLGAILGTNENPNLIMLKILGEHHLRWTRYYLLKDDADVGLEYRNRMAHLRDINPKTFSLYEYLKVTWIVLSTINTILVNLINDEELDLFLNNNK